MPNFTTATVSEILLERQGLQRVALTNGSKAYALTEVIGPVSVGDKVIVNTTAVDLDLGTGGYHVIHWNLERDSFSTPSPGHIIKARYLSEQTQCATIEESFPLKPLAGRPVVVCELHSQMGLLACMAKQLQPDIRIAYVMTDQATLPIALSDLVDQLLQDNIIDTSVTTGQAFGGKLEAVSVASALAHVDADLYLVSPGPGVVGTATKFGFSGYDCIANLNAALHTGGTAFFALRASSSDKRDRHNGISHHSLTVLEGASDQVRVAIPSSTTETISWNGHIEVVDIPDIDIPQYITSMGRSTRDDKLFWDYVAATAVAVAST